MIFLGLLLFFSINLKFGLTPLLIILLYKLT